MKTRNWVLILTLGISLGIHGLLFLWGQTVPQTPHKRLIAIQCLEKKVPHLTPQKPPVPKVTKGVRPLGKRTGVRPMGTPHTPPKFGISKENTAGEVALPEGNTLIADPQATPEATAAVMPREESEHFIASGECDAPAIPKTEIQAIYPEFAKTGHIEGKVILELDIDSAGTIVDIRVLKSPHPALSEAAVQAIRGTHFTPALKDGSSVAVTMRYPFTFSLTP